MTEQKPPQTEEDKEEERKQLIGEVVRAVVAQLQGRFDETVAQEDRDLRKQSALALSGEVHNNFRHWDALKWATTGWFASIGVGVVFVQADSRPLRAAAYLLFLFGLMAWLLIGRITAYHQHAQNRLQDLLPKLLSSPLDQACRNALALELGFTFGSRKTVTYWYRWVVLALVLGCFSVAVLGPWYLSNQRKDSPAPKSPATATLSVTGGAGGLNNLGIAGVGGRSAEEAATSGVSSPDRHDLPASPSAPTAKNTARRTKQRLKRTSSGPADSGRSKD